MNTNKIFPSKENLADLLGQIDDFYLSGSPQKERALEKSIAILAGYPAGTMYEETPEAKTDSQNYRDSH